MTPKLSYELMNHWARASERRVLLIVGVRYTFSNFLIFASSRLHMPSSHIHIFTFSHLHIFTYHLRISSPLHIFWSSHLHISSFTYSHLILTYHLRIFTSTHTIFTSSHLHIFTSYPHVFTSSLSLSLPLFLFSLEAAGGADEAPRNGYPFARNNGRSSKTEVTLRFWGFQRLCVRGLCVNAFVCVTMCLCVCACKSGCA